MKCLVNSIINGIADAVHSEFGNEYNIYIDEKEQGFNEPCFFILPIKLDSQKFIGKRYYKDFGFAIHYFQKEDSVRDRNDVFERLCECLEYISIDNDITMGKDMRSEVSDGVLICFVRYSAFVYKATELEPMEEIDYTIGGLENE